MTPFSIYVAASYRHMHAVSLLYGSLRRVCPMIDILDWTQHATPPDGLSATERRAWMDTDPGDTVFQFCRNACASADLVIYLGQSGQDAGVEVGLALGAGVEVIGLRGPLESPGLMLNGAVSVWAKDVTDLQDMVVARIKAKQELDGENCGDCDNLFCECIGSERLVHKMEFHKKDQDIVWTKAPPSVPGWYWRKVGRTDIVCVFRAANEGPLWCEYGGQHVHAAELNALWAGPIAKPAEAIA